jgi:putative ABC transport system ATP-binding protein
MLSLSNIEFAYENQPAILKIDQLDLKAGERVFLYGPSGCGKSTLLNIIAGVIKPQNGQVNILGKDLFALSASKRDQFRGEHLGYIFQSFNLLPFLTVKENIELASTITKTRRCTSSELAEIISALKIDHLLEKKALTLSVGEQQRVAVARALYGRPEIIIADEPTSALDEEVSEQFMELLISQQAKKSFVLLFVSHDKRLMKFFDRVISLPEINQRGRNS